MPVISSFYAMGGLHLSCMNLLAAYHCTAAAEACSPRPPFSQVHQDEASLTDLMMCALSDMLSVRFPICVLWQPYDCIVCVC